MADALSQEESPRTVTRKDPEHPDVSLASGDVEAGAPHVRENVGTGAPQRKEDSKDCVRVATPT